MRIMPKEDTVDNPNYALDASEYSTPAALITSSTGASSITICSNVDNHPRREDLRWLVFAILDANEHRFPAENTSEFAPSARRAVGFTWSNDEFTSILEDVALFPNLSWIPEGSLRAESMIEKRRIETKYPQSNYSS